MKAKKINIFYVALLILLMIIATDCRAATDTLDKQQKALKVIGDFAERLCSVPFKGDTDNLELSSDARVKLKGLIKKLADLDVGVSAKYQSAKWQGALQKDIAGLLRNKLECKQKVFKDLKDKLLISAVQEPTQSRPSTIKNVSCGKISSTQNCPLEIDAYSYELPHPDGSNVDGIKWSENSDSDVRVMLTNKSLARIQNINFILKPETHIRSAVQATGIPGVIISPDRGPIREMALEGVDSSGKHIIEAVPTVGEFIAPQVRLQGSELLGNGEMKIVLACIALNPMVNGEFPKTLIAPRHPPQWIHIDGTYETTEAGSHKRFHFTQEFQLTK